MLNKESTSERFIGANRVAQVIAVAIFSVGVGLNLWLPELFDGLTSGMSVQELTRFGDRFQLVSLGVAICLAVLCSYYIGHMGFRAITSGEFPPPGALVIQRTKVRFGWRARLAGWVSIALALIAWLPVVVVGYDIYAR